MRPLSFSPVLDGVLFSDGTLALHWPVDGNSALHPHPLPEYLDLADDAPEWAVKMFHLHRTADVSGVSGTGVVAEGAEFSDGRCVIHWLTETTSTGFYGSVAELEDIHGHGGRTKVVFQ